MSCYDIKAIINASGLQTVLKMVSNVYISMSFLSLISTLEPAAQVSSLITSESGRPGVKLGPAMS